MTWNAQREALIKAGYLDRTFLNSVEQTVTGQLILPHQDPHGGDEYTYEPRLLHQHVTSCASLLDRVLAFRREARDLEILATKVAMDYQLFDQSTTIDEALDVSRLGVNARELALITHENAAKAFGMGDALQQGFRVANEGRQQEVQSELNSIGEQIKLIRQRYQLHRAYQAAYRKKHSEPGNAHNYVERCVRLTQLFVQDLREAYEKSKAIVVGLRTLWDFDLPLPSPDDPSFIDLLVDWNRDAVRFLEFVDQNNVTFELVIPLTQAWSGENAPIIEPAKFRAAFEGATNDRTAIIPFRLNADLFFNQPVRVLEAGVSYGNALDLVHATGMDRNATKDSYARLRVQLSLPTQSYADGSSKHPTSIVLGSVGLFGSNVPLDRCASNAIRYIDPVGDWQAEVSPLAVYKDGSTQSIARGVTGSAPISDLKIHLRLVIVGSSFVDKLPRHD